MALVAIAAWAMSGCGFGHQPYSMATLLGSKERVDREHERRGRLPTKAELSLAIGPEPPRDGWGRDIVYDTWTDARGEHYVLVALGRDGRPECDSGPCYCAMTAKDVHGALDADLVICDGQALRTAGK